MYNGQAKSVRSVKTMRSLETYNDEYINLGQIIVDALKQYECPIEIIVNKISEKPERKLQPIKSESRKSSTIKSDTETIADETHTGNTLTIDTLYDNHGNFVAISINKYKCQPIPRMVIQVLGLLSQNFTKLTKLTIKDSFADKYTILELQNMLNISTTITDICLDSSVILEGNYDLLLLQLTSLRNLSLRSCKINDEVCNRISRRLYFLQPAETTLLTLNLSSNWITDTGAESIAKALRSNRHLRYLNLSDNHISDYGAELLLDVLKEFNLNYDENINRRRMYYQYLSNRNAIYDQCFKEFENKTINNISTGKKPGGKSLSKQRDSKNVERKSTPGNEVFLKNKKKLNASDLIGPFDHPFNKSQVINRDGNSYCIGNFVLCYLNLAYNNLGYSSIQKLLKVLEYQEKHKSKDMTGLIRAVIEGNNLPSKCLEINLIYNILYKAIPNTNSTTGSRNK